MAFSDDVRKALTDRTHLYFVAGAGDLAVSKLREVPGKLAALREEPPITADRVQNALFDAQARITETLSTPPDVRSLPGRAQAFALTSLGRAGEAVLRAHDGYQELAERGRSVVDRLRTPHESTEESTSDSTDAPEAAGSSVAPAAPPATEKPTAGTPDDVTTGPAARQTSGSASRSGGKAAGAKSTSRSRSTTTKSTRAKTGKTAAAKTATAKGRAANGGASGDSTGGA